MAQASLDKLAHALEKVEVKLAKIEGMLASGSGAGAGSASPAAGGASLDAWDALVASHIPQFVTDSKAIAEDVGQCVRFPWVFCWSSRPSSFCSPLATIEDFIVSCDGRNSCLLEFGMSFAVVIGWTPQVSWGCFCLPGDLARCAVALG